jgi:hypothetical protein
MAMGVFLQAAFFITAEMLRTDWCARNIALRKSLVSGRRSSALAVQLISIRSAVDNYEALAPAIITDISVFISFKRFLILFEELVELFRGGRGSLQVEIGLVT